MNSTVLYWMELSLLLYLIDEILQKAEAFWLNGWVQFVWNKGISLLSLVLSWHIA